MKPLSIPRWKTTVAILCIAYVIAAWVLPTFMLPFVNLLPYVHESNFHQRLMVSIFCSIFVIFIMFILDPKRFTKDLRISKTIQWSEIKSRAGVTLGLVMFTFCVAEFSPNLFGALTKLLPSTAYEEAVEVEEADFKGSKYKSVSLTLRSNSDGRLIYLVLSKRLFEYPHFKVGDTLKLYGEKNIIGAYVAGFELINNRLTNGSRPFAPLTRDGLKPAP